MLKHPSLLTQAFNNNNQSQEKIFKHMCNFGAQSECRNGIRAFSSYLDVDIINDQYRMVNPTSLDCIAGYTTEGDIGDRALKRLPHQNMNIIDGSISSY